jgi:hypothetical protein
MNRHIERGILSDIFSGINFHGGRSNEKNDTDLEGGTRLKRNGCYMTGRAN